MTKEEILAELKEIESRVCALSIKVVDQNQGLNFMLIGIGKRLITIYGMVKDDFDITGALKVINGVVADVLLSDTGDGESN